MTAPLASGKKNVLNIYSSMSKKLTKIETKNWHTQHNHRYNVGGALMWVGVLKDLLIRESMVIRSQQNVPHI